MLLKTFDLKKININLNKFILFYGKNEGLKNDAISGLVKNKDGILNYDEKEILENHENFINDILTKSFFEKEKIIIIKRATDKIIKIIDELKTKNLEDTMIIINAENLAKLTYNFLKEKNIPISPSNINLIVSKCNGDRETLLNELKKIEYFCKNGRKITLEHIIKLTNLAENHSITELVDNCLAKNKNKIISILNENNFGNEDCILITRTFLNKSKKILKLSNEFKANKNIDLTISTAKPPIFWKDKEITKQQIFKWRPENIKQLIYKLNEVELLIKKNIINSTNIIIDFILDQSSSNTNN